MEKVNLLNVEPENLKQIGTIAGIVTAVVVLFYITGVVRNIKQIQKLNQEKSKPLTISEE